MHFSVSASLTRTSIGFHSHRLSAMRVKIYIHHCTKKRINLCSNNYNKMLSILAHKSIKQFIFCCLLCLILSKSTAQEEFIQPPSKLLTTVPFSLLSGGIVLIKATVDSTKDTLTFIFDTEIGRAHV